MQTRDKIAIIGAKGKAGKFLVEQAMREGYHVRILTRNPDLISN
ncbi:nmrA-like family protein [Bacillus clarus]|uniref:NmrA-like family protein n=1 Tax=Bacillus clarus TaxID=2338372 RepID=A0A090YL79_9BACI|nr:nmrA-like family protein [Bacillus clarus]